MKKAETMKLGSADYAKVNTRMQIFRTENSRGSVETSAKIEGEYIIFSATIIKDLADTASARATGTAMKKNDGKDKTFEKTETIAVGRALAFLGYSASGDIASSEEMEDYEEYLEHKKIEAEEYATELLTNCKTQEELKTVWSGLDGQVKQNTNVEALKDELKAKLK